MHDEAIFRFEEAEAHMHPEARKRWAQVADKLRTEPAPGAEDAAPASEEVIAEQVRNQARLWLDVVDLENRINRTSPEHCWCERCHPFDVDEVYARILLVARRGEPDYIVRHFGDGLGDSPWAYARDEEYEWLEPTQEAIQRWADEWEARIRELYAMTTQAHRRLVWAFMHEGRYLSHKAEFKMPNEEAALHFVLQLPDEMVEKL